MGSQCGSRSPRKFVLSVPRLGAAWSEPPSYPSWVAGLAHRSPGGADRGRYALRRVRLGDELELDLEPDNADDPRAVAIYHGDFHLGYVPERHDWVAESLNKGDTLLVIVTAIEISGFLSFRRVTNLLITISVIADGD